ncbi:MAG: response regulator [Cyclobacteriaceae bacterium]|nr:response regulator [Cyclobacteriaceae bacterium]
MSNSLSILIIDDEAQIRKLLAITLQSNGYSIQEAASGKEALTCVAMHPPDLILLDLGLPDQSGHDVLKHLREWFTNPVIIVSVQNGEEDIVKALDAGANDYLIKPFRTGELLARIRSALRKAASVANMPVADYTDLFIDFANRIVKKDNVTVKLTATEYSLLSLFAQNEGKVLTHQYLLQHVWGPTHQNESQYLRVFVAQLRKKIETDPNRPAHIITESGVGYRFIGHGNDHS